MIDTNEIRDRFALNESSYDRAKIGLAVQIDILDELRAIRMLMTPVVMVDSNMSGALNHAVDCPARETLLGPLKPHMIHRCTCKAPDALG